jgi:small subunit ribosomal protein S20
MANHASALKAHRQSQKRNLRNRSNRSTLRTELKSFVAEVESGKIADPKANLSELYSVVDKAAKKKALSKNAAGRRKSRLTKRLNKAIASAAKD